MSARIDALIFDVFGTLVDWRTGVASRLDAEFSKRNISVDPYQLADAWRGEYQPAMEPIRSGRRSYVPLDLLHMENLVAVLDRHRIRDCFSAEELRRLSRAWESLPPWPDTVPGLALLKRHYIVAPCSNGSIALMTRLAKFAGLPWDAILGADIARSYKPDPAVYRDSAAALGLEPDRVMMVAAHEDDLAAAAACGLRTAYLHRPHEFGGDTGAAPAGDWDCSATSVEALAAQLAR